ncbi:hypothetical protein MJL48_30370, partial [Salmonella enterica subsp. enterica serovar Kentucky]|nr:hypothetical protein [Salmonella enterica subsp. enterica serovar Kentucky]
PHMFAAASLMLLNKVDLLPYLNFDVEKCIASAREVNPEIEIIALLIITGLIIGTLVVAMYLPIFHLGDAMSGMG